MTVKIEGIEYNCESIMNSSLKKYENLTKTLNDDKLEYADKMVYSIKELSDIPLEILEVADLIQLNNLFNELTKIEDVEIESEFTIDGIKYVTSKKFDSYEDIKLNRSQHKIVKKYMVTNNNYIAAIIACYFTPDGNQLIVDDEDFENRVKLFNDNMPFKIAIPFITKVIQTVAIQMGESVDVLKVIKAND